MVAISANHCVDCGRSVTTRATSHCMQRRATRVCMCSPCSSSYPTESEVWQRLISCLGPTGPGARARKR